MEEHYYLKQKECQWCKEKKTLLMFSPTSEVCRQCIYSRRLKASRRLGSVDRKHSPFRINHDGFFKNKFYDS